MLQLQYALLFIDYLIKWVKVVAILNQRAETIAKMFVEHVVCRHGAPRELRQIKVQIFFQIL